MKNRIFVLDQDYLRAPELSQLIESQQSDRFLLSDAAMIELFKSDEWETTVRKSLATLSKYPHRCIAGTSIGLALKFEIENERSCDGYLVDRETNCFLRQLLKEIRDEEDGSAFSLLRQRSDAVRAEVAEENLKHYQNLESLKNLTDVTASSLGAERVSALRGRKVPVETKLQWIRESGPSLLTPFFEEVGMSEQKRHRFLRKKPLVLRYIFLKAWFSIHWITYRGIENLKANRATNHILDHDYVLMATFFDGILSRDSLANDAYRELSLMLQQ